VRNFFYLVLAALLGTIAASGCNLESVLEQIPEPQSTAGGGSSTTAKTPLPTDHISIASFNIQVFGQSKMNKPDVMEKLTDVARRFDILAVQELRSKEQDVVPRWLAMINANGSNYDALVGPRLGRTSSTEQYIFVYNRNRVRFTPKTEYTINDPHDLLHREPFVASFEAIVGPGVTPFSFTLINIHTDPDETDEELDALAEVYEVVRQSNPAEDDVILLGDLNVDYTDLGLLGQVPNIAWTVQGQPTNTRLSKSYDNILFDRVATTEFTGQSGIVNLMDVYQMTEEQALDVSDHLPVWATFSVAEAGTSSLAQTPANPVR